MAKLNVVALAGTDQPFKLVLTPANHAEKRRALEVSGASPSSTHTVIYYPLEPLIVQDLQDALPRGVKLELTATAMDWYVTTCDNAATAVALGRQPDARCTAGWAPRLYPYQRVGTEWLYHVGRGILGDDPGLGKTIQALTAVRNQDHVLIVTLNSIKQHWERHIREWLQQDVRAISGSHSQRQLQLSQRPDWMIINHEMLRGGQYKEVLNRQWDAVIIDEAHKLQGRNSQQSRGADMLRADRLLLLTGTPIWNRPDSLWHLLNLLDRHRFGSYWRFVNEYCEVEMTPWATEIVGVHPDKLPRLQSVLAPMVLRRRKVDVLPELPPKIIETVEYTLTPAQHKVYHDIKRRLRRESAGGEVRAYDNAAAALSDLRLLCDAPALLGYSASPYHTNPKDKVIDDLLDSLLGEGRKIVVYTWHKAYAQYLFERYAPVSRGGALLVTGDTPNRDATVQLWRESTIPTLVATIASVGMGIDLIEATAAIFAEGSYVPVLNAQAEDRLHRIGTKDSPLIYRLAARDTVEQVIWDVADDRADMANEVLAFAEVARRTLAQGD